MDIDWVLVKGFQNKDIGAIGFIGNKAAIITAFHEDADGNLDGKTTFFEKALFKINPLGTKGIAVVNVAMKARGNMDIMIRDPSFNNAAIKQFTEFATGLVVDGIYISYFNFSVGQAAKSISKNITGNIVKQYIIRKGMEKTVKNLYYDFAGVHP